MKIIAIVAHDQNYTIGNRGKLPWNLPEDLKNFRTCTLGHPIIMGSSTYVSIGRPLPNRRNIVLSSTMVSEPGIEVYSSISACLDALRGQVETVFVIGGSKVYQQFLNQGLLDGIWVSEVPGVHEGDVYFPEYRERFILEKEQAFETFVFKQYTRLP